MQGTSVYNLTVGNFINRSVLVQFIFYYSKHTHKTNANFIKLWLILY